MIRQRFRAGEGVACRFFSMNKTYLFIGAHNYGPTKNKLLWCAFRCEAGAAP